MQIGSIRELFPGKKFDQVQVEARSLNESLNVTILMFWIGL
jgi:hypothetical protein